MNKEKISRALYGVRWLGNNLHNSHTELFKDLYKALLEDVNTAIKELEKE